MKRRKFITTATLLTASAALTPSAWAAHDGKVGTIDMDDWKKLNKEAGEKVKAIKPDSEKLSDADEKLMMEIAMGGMMQLELSAIASTKGPARMSKRMQWPRWRNRSCSARSSRKSPMPRV